MKILLLVPMLSILLISCDAFSTNDNTKDENTDNLKHIIEEEKIKEDALRVIEADIVISEPSVDWEPRIIKTPVSQPHKPFYFPESRAQEIKNYLYREIDSNLIKGKQLDENKYLFRGYIQYIDGIDFDYSFIKDTEGYFGKTYTLSSDYKSNEEFSKLHMNLIYKMLEISSIENPQQFFQELINSPKITKYTGCTVQLKQAKYGVIDLTSCEEDDATVLALYNPELE
ncbi:MULTISPECIES: hypothetical protein [unclassified Psychrobacter]|nr:hypothetical protein [Psychrobacter sp. FME13]MBE0443533.1 hypothetical protein [Psychrobacter sp. FME13]